MPISAYTSQLLEFLPTVQGLATNFNAPEKEATRPLHLR